MSRHVLIMKFPFSSSFGGGEHHTLTLVQELQRRDIRFWFVGSCRVLLDAFAQRGWTSQRLWAGREPVTVGNVLLFPFTALFVWLILTVTLIRYRVVHRVRVLYCLSLTEKLLLPVVARCLGMRVIWMEHVGFDRWLTHSPYRFAYVLFSRLVTVVCPSRSLADDVIRIGVPSHVVRVIPHGIDLERFTPRPDTARHETFTVGCVARLEPEKGIEQLLIAFSRAREFVPRAKLLLVGDGSQRRKLEWLSCTLEIGHDVQFVGFQQPVQRWFHAFDCFVLPSVRRESFGIVLLEALASGVPSITTAVGGTTEIIRDGETGIVVPPKNPDAIAGAIVRIAQHPDQADVFARAGRQLVEQEYSERHMIDQWAHLVTESA